MGLFGVNYLSDFLIGAQYLLDVARSALESTQFGHGAGFDYDDCLDLVFHMICLGEYRKALGLTNSLLAVIMECFKDDEVEFVRQLGEALSIACNGILKKIGKKLKIA